MFDRPYRTPEPVNVTLLIDADENVWMSDPPQERMMMHANAMHTCGSVLVGGLGLGIYPQYAANRADGATRFTIVERSPEVVALIEPVLCAALSVEYRIVQQPIDEFLESTDEQFDTIFLDTWETLDPKRLPPINRLRDRALSRLRPGGTVLLWGYRWMVEMFTDACRRFLALDPAQRAERRGVWPY